MVGMPRVGKISRGIFRSASAAPRATAITATMMVNGRRNAGWTRVIVKPSLRPGSRMPARVHNSAPFARIHVERVTGMTRTYYCQRTGTIGPGPRMGGRDSQQPVKSVFQLLLLSRQFHLLSHLGQKVGAVFRKSLLSILLRN